MIHNLNIKGLIKINKQGGISIPQVFCIIIYYNILKTMEKKEMFDQLYSNFVQFLAENLELYIRYL
ncbi:hypothetical protein BKI52_04300 [marine bacterium AO1-C]|nr:hypothetical protein BKI52_04300 [marine bacterium AO1-C]